MTSSLLKKLGVIVPLAFFSLFPNYSIAGEKKKNKTYSFYNFGQLSFNPDGIGGNSVTTVTTADIDGDGDQDIIIGTESHQNFIYIIENKMPQKNKEQQEPSSKK